MKTWVRSRSAHAGTSTVVVSSPVSVVMSCPISSKPARAAPIPIRTGVIAGRPLVSNVTTVPAGPLMGEMNSIRRDTVSSASSLVDLACPESPAAPMRAVPTARRAETQNQGLDHRGYCGSMRCLDMAGPSILSRLHWPAIDRPRLCDSTTPRSRCLRYPTVPCGSEARVEGPVSSTRRWCIVWGGASLEHELHSGRLARGRNSLVEAGTKEEGP